MCPVFSKVSMCMGGSLICMGLMRDGRGNIEEMMHRKIRLYLGKIQLYLHRESASRVTGESAVAPAVTVFDRPSPTCPYLNGRSELNPQKTSPRETAAAGAVGFFADHERYY